MDDARRGIDHIGVTCVFVVHDGQGRMLMQKRSQNCRDEKGAWDNGGGALEFGETFEEGVRREIDEEFGVAVIKLEYLGAYNVLRRHADTPTHWVAIGFAAQVDPSEVKIGDPDKIDEIGWFTSANLPQPLHSQSMRDIQAALRAGIIR